MDKQSPKVFKLSERSIDAGASESLRLKHTFANNSTRKHYPGKHSIAIQVNGIVIHSFEFDLA